MITIHLNANNAKSIELDELFYLNGRSLKGKSASEIYDLLIDAMRNKELYVELCNNNIRIFLPKTSIALITQNGDVQKEDLNKVFWSFL